MSATETALRQNLDAYMAAEYLSEEEKDFIRLVVELGITGLAKRKKSRTEIHKKIDSIRRKRLRRLRKVKDEGLPVYFSEYSGDIYYTVLNEEYPCEGCSNVRQCAGGKACEAFREYIYYGGWESQREPTTDTYRLIFE